MDCQQTDRDELVEQYLKGQLTATAQDEFETHILDCRRCLQAVEVLQSVRDELAERAHEVRAQAPVRTGWFRWQLAAGLAVLLIALGVALSKYRHHGTTAVVLAPATTPQNPVLSPEPAKQNEQGGTQVARAVPTPAQSHPKKSTMTAGVPAHEVAPPSPVKEAANTPVPAPPIVAPAPMIPAPAQVQPKYASPQPTSSPANEPINDEIASELFRLGDVQAPPYTFSGFAASLDKQHLPRRGAEGAIAVQPGQAKIAEGRAHFQEAMGDYVEKRYRDAAVLLEEAVDAEPNAPDSNFFLGVCRLMIARPDEAIAPLSTVIANAQSSYTQAAHFYLAKAYIQKSDLTRAEEHLRAAEAMPGRMTTLAHSTLTKLEAVRAKQQNLEQPKAPQNPN